MKAITRLLAGMALAAFAVQTSAVPISGTDSVTVGARQWAQVDLFAGLTWTEINAVCPGGTCGTGTLNGYDMPGWTWATTDAVNTLFNHYLAAAGIVGADLLGPGPDYYDEADSAWAADFFADGWRATSDQTFSKFLAGHAYDRFDATYNYFPQVIYLPNPFNTDVIRTDSTILDDWPQRNVGGWFYREAAGVPAPATTGLFGLALAYLCLSRSQKGRRNPAVR